MNNDNTVETGRIAAQNCQGSYATTDFLGLARELYSYKSSTKAIFPLQSHRSETYPISLFRKTQAQHMIWT